MSSSEDNKDWEFSDSEHSDHGDHDNYEQEKKPTQNQLSPRNREVRPPREDRPAREDRPPREEKEMATPDPNVKRSDLQALVDESDKYEYRRDGGGRGRGRRGDRDGGYRGGRGYGGGRGGGMREKELSSYSSRIWLSQKLRSSMLLPMKSLANCIT